MISNRHDTNSKESHQHLANHVSYIDREENIVKIL
jgi:hypothetical protein